MTVERLLIVNADDFGAGRQINRGIVEAHQRGIVTSASLMVDMPGAEDAAALARTAPRLSVGLHVCLTTETRVELIDLADAERCRFEIGRQLQRHERLIGRAPTHLDTHHYIHRDPRLLPVLEALAAEHALPLREHSRVRHCTEFYAQWERANRPEHVSVEYLVVMLKTRIGPGITELSCHPGYLDADFPTSYAQEREWELATLCDPTLPGVLAAERIHLINFSSIGRRRAQETA